MHTLLDFDGELPVYVNITEGSVGNNKDLPMVKGSAIVADRYFNDFPMLKVWDSNGFFFVIRHKDNLSFTSLSERELPKNTAQHVLKVQVIELNNPESKTKYPGKLRRVVVWDEVNKQTIELVTNNFKRAAQTKADLYKSRWQIEVFF